MANLTVKGFNKQKDYGFIQTDDEPTDVFIHIAAVERSGHWHLRDKADLRDGRGQRGKAFAVGVKAKQVESAT